MTTEQTDMIKAINYRITNVEHDPICPDSYDRMFQLIEMDGEEKKMLSYQEFEELLAIVGMGWYGIDNWTGGDLELFEEYFPVVSPHPNYKTGEMCLWNNKYDYSELDEQIRAEFGKA